MSKKSKSCCKVSEPGEVQSPELPEQIQADLASMGGLEALARSIPAKTKLETYSRIFKGLSDPIRLSILYIIRDKPLCVCVINRLTKISGSKLSYHLTSLKEAGLIERKSQGNWIIYSITERGRWLLQCMERA